MIQMKTSRTKVLIRWSVTGIITLLSVYVIIFTYALWERLLLNLISK